MRRATTDYRGPGVRVEVEVWNSGGGVATDVEAIVEWPDTAFFELYEDVTEWPDRFRFDVAVGSHDANPVGLSAWIGGPKATRPPLRAPHLL